MKCLIVDDNKLARMALKELLNQTKTLTLAGECSSGVEAYDFLNKNDVDLVILDIEMPGMTGIELLKSVIQKPIIIFSSSKIEYAVDAFELNVADYIVKPVTLPRLIQAVAKAKTIFENRNTSVNNVSPEFIFLKDKKALIKIGLNEILWLEAMGDYIKIHTAAKVYMVHSTLKMLEEKMPSSQFMKVHRSYVVAINKIESIKDGLIAINNTSIPLAESFRSHLIEKLNLI